MEEKDIKILKEATEKLINDLAWFNGLCLRYSGSDGIYIDIKVNELIIELNDLNTILRFLKD